MLNFVRKVKTRGKKQENNNSHMNGRYEWIVVNVVKLQNK